MEGGWGEVGMVVPVGTGAAVVMVAVGVAVVVIDNPRGGKVGMTVFSIT